MWNNFTTNEVVNPLFDDCPAKNWIELPGEIRQNLIHTMDIVQSLRDYTGLAIRLNSTYRPKSIGSAHSLGKAIDCQFIKNDKLTYLNSMEWFKEGCPFNGYRVIMEWSGRNDGIPWFHIDRDYKDNGNRILMIGYPEGGISGAKMVFTNWTGGLPEDYI